MSIICPRTVPVTCARAVPGDSASAHNSNVAPSAGAQLDLRSGELISTSSERENRCPKAHMCASSYRLQDANAADRGRRDPIGGESYPASVHGVARDVKKR